MSSLCAAEMVEDLVGRCHELRVLATSREPLMIPGEVLWPLAPLELHDAVALFMARAGAVRAFVPGDRYGRHTADRELCERLDCLPLTIELAAARMRTFTPDDLLSRLDDRFRLLTFGARTAYPRQQTLRAVIDWSYDLLFDDERRMLERISLFAGRFGVAAAEEVCANATIAEDDVAELLARLVDRSFLTARRSAGAVDFRVLQTLAQYGREQLERSGDTAAARTRHAAYVAHLVEVADGRAWCGRGELAWHRR